MSAAPTSRSGDIFSGINLLSRARGPGDPARFRQLVERWKRDTEFTSSTTEMAVHPAYQQIIGMGLSAVPLLLDELRREPDHWFWALAAITGEDPVPVPSRGRVAEMTDAWVRWGRDNGWI